MKSKIVTKIFSGVSKVTRKVKVRQISRVSFKSK